MTKTMLDYAKAFQAAYCDFERAEQAYESAREQVVLCRGELERIKEVLSEDERAITVYDVGTGFSVVATRTEVSIVRTVRDE